MSLAYKITHFKASFPQGFYIERSAAKFDFKLDRYVDFDLNIGWAMKNVNSNLRSAKGNVRRYTKTCQGFVYCGTESCEFYNKQCRPAVSNQALKKQLEKGCELCNRPLLHNNTCTASAEYIFDEDVCTLTHFGTHDHNDFQSKDDGFKETKEDEKRKRMVYITKRLSVQQQKKLDDYLVKHPHITPKAAVVGNNPVTGQVVGSVTGSDPVLGKRDRTEYELKKARIRTGKVAGDLFEEFDRIQHDYPGYIYSASVALDAFIITFRAPEMSSFVDMKLFPVITDVTFKAVKNSGEHKRYLCSSTLYFSSIRRHALVFQAIIGGLNEMYFHQYFLAFFTAYKVDFISEDNFLGMIMDFSAAQRKGFLSAYKMYTYGREDGLKYLKGCYMHWMKSVQLVSSNGNLVRQEDRDDFLRLVYSIRTTENGSVFNSTRDEIIVKYPGLSRWIKWWLRPQVSSMIFRYNSSMKPSLQTHIARTSNAIESYHNVLYGVILKNAPLITSFPQILQCARFKTIL